MTEGGERTLTLNTPVSSEGVAWVRGEIDVYVMGARFGSLDPKAVVMGPSEGRRLVGKELLEGPLDGNVYTPV